MPNAEVVALAVVPFAVLVVEGAVLVCYDFLRFDGHETPPRLETTKL